MASIRNRPWRPAVTGCRLMPNRKHRIEGQELFMMIGEGWGGRGLGRSEFLRQAVPPAPPF